LAVCAIGPLIAPAGLARATIMLATLLAASLALFFAPRETGAQHERGRKAAPVKANQDNAHPAS
jgi:hypothetical protein